MAARSMDSPTGIPSTAPAEGPPCQAAERTSTTARERPRETSSNRVREDRDMSRVQASTTRLTRRWGERRPSPGRCAGEGGAGGSTSWRPR